jgi:hypothetical protein
MVATTRYDPLPLDKTVWLTSYKRYAEAEAAAGLFLNHLRGTAPPPPANPANNAALDRIKYIESKQKEFLEGQGKAWKFLVAITKNHLSSLLTPHETTRDPVPVWQAILI